MRWYSSAFNFNVPNKGRKHTFNFAYLGRRAGVYIIKENETVVYVGKSLFWLKQTLLNHFTKYTKDRASEHYRANYFEMRELWNYSAAAIEVPYHHDTTKKQVEKEVTWLEWYLINYFDPRDNVKSKIEYPVSPPNKKDWFDEGFIQDEIADGDDELPF